jgi:hypothetical protein
MYPERGLVSSDGVGLRAIPLLQFRGVTVKEILSRPQEFGRGDNHQATCKCTGEQ